MDCLSTCNWGFERFEPSISFLHGICGFVWHGICNLHRNRLNGVSLDSVFYRILICLFILLTMGCVYHNSQI